MNAVSKKKKNDKLLVAIMQSKAIKRHKKPRAPPLTRATFRGEVSLS